jgi:xanthosine utilization system XapX-like protein
MWVCLFIFYLANYFVIVFFNVALVSAASSRLARGHATINDGLQAAWERKGRILQWALLAATVGILLKMMEERMSWIGRLVVRLIGVAWTLASYFVVPVLAAEDLGPVEALKRSAHVFRETWGEKVVGGFSFGLIFTLLALPGIALPLLGAALLGPAGMVVGGVVMMLYWLLLSVVSAATEGIFTAALYRYATTKEVAAGFRPENFSMAWQPKR